MFHSQAGLFDESFDYEFQEQKNKCWNDEFLTYTAIFSSIT